MLASYAKRADQPDRIALGEGLVGQCATEKQRILLTQVTADYTRIHTAVHDEAVAALEAL